MSPIPDSNVVAALVGAVSALLFTAGRDWWVARKRKKNVATALVLELRAYERKMRADLTAAEQHKVVVFDPLFSEALFTTYLGELPNLGGSVFLAVRAAYSQYRQLGYIKSKLQQRYETPQIFPVDDLIQTYVAATRQGLARTEDALKALRSVAPSDAFRTELPAITDVTELEKSFYRKKGD